MTTRCECCNQPIPEPTPLCADCGHPLASHHRTDTGNITYCTIWTSTDPRKPSRQCDCKKGTP